MKYVSGWFLQRGTWRMILAVVVGVSFLTISDVNNSVPAENQALGLPENSGSELQHQSVFQGGQMSVAEIMANPAAQGPTPFNPLRMRKGLKDPDRRNLPQAPGATDATQWPPRDNSQPEPLTPFAPQTLGISFDGATGPTETGAFPPDVMGAAGPSQFVVFLNGRLRTFNKTTGVADGVLNLNPDVFFASVTTPPGVGQTTFTSDPNVRYDRLSGRWFLTIIDVTLTGGGAIATANRLLVAVSDAASNGVISANTVFTFYWYSDASGLFMDYPSLGVDASALYIGVDMFSLAGSFQNTYAFIIPKSLLLTGSPALIWRATNLLVSNVGPFAPRGVDNFDPTNTGPTATGYFIGVDFATFNTLMMRRVTNPGSTDLGTPPTITGNISISTTLTTSFPVKVPHLGNTGGNNGRLDAIDDRLYAAHLRNGRLWTAHNIGVGNAGTTTSQNRNAARWYEIQNVSATPTVLQTGTLYDNATPNDVNQRSYWIPTIMVSGQGHAALGCSIAGTSERINAFTTGRLIGDALGTLRDGPGGASLPGYTSSSTAYNPPGNPGGTNGRRWGDYSFVSLDPNDDMTMWCIQEYCNGTNTYGVQIVRLLAPKPAKPSSATPAIVAPLSSVDATITGTSSNGTGFFDPGAGFPNRISVSMLNDLGATGTVTVNNVAYLSPTSLSLNLTTTGANGDFRVIVTNPDGQKDTSATFLLTVDPALPVQLSSFTGTFVGSDRVLLDWTTISEVNNFGFEVQKAPDLQVRFETITGSFVPGHGTTIEPQFYSYIHESPNASSIYYRLKQIDFDGSVYFSDPIMVQLVTSATSEAIPKVFSLSQNYPNPFNPSTTIVFELPTPAPTTLKIYDSEGREIKTLVNETLGPGRFENRFDTSNLASGVYFYTLKAGTFVQTKKLVLLR